MFLFGFMPTDDLEGDVVCFCDVFADNFYLRILLDDG